jgi:hypothetical protein
MFPSANTRGKKVERQERRGSIAYQHGVPSDGGLQALNPLRLGQQAAALPPPLRRGAACSGRARGLRGCFGSKRAETMPIIPSDAQPRGSSIVRGVALVLFLLALAAILGFGAVIYTTRQPIRIGRLLIVGPSSGQMIIQTLPASGPPFLYLAPAPPRPGIPPTSLSLFPLGFGRCLLPTQYGNVWLLDG